MMLGKETLRGTVAQQLFTLWLQASPVIPKSILRFAATLFFMDGVILPLHNSVDMFHSVMAPPWCSGSVVVGTDILRSYFDDGPGSRHPAHPVAHPPSSMFDKWLPVKAWGR